MEQILPHIWRIPVPLLGSPLKELNAYLIQGEDRSLLIDTGFRHPACREALESALAELGTDRSTLDILLTHAHSDHSGMAPEVVGPGRSIFVNLVDHKQLNDPKHWAKRRVENFTEEGFSPDELAQIGSNPAKAMAPKDSDQWDPIEDGAVLTCGGYRLEAVFTPGHTPGHMCYYLREQKVMFTGDHVLFDITPNITNWPHTEDSLGNYLTSLDKIAGYEVELALPGHRATGNFYERIEAIKAHHARRLAEACELTGEYPGSTTYQLAGLMRWKVRGRTNSWTDFPLAQKWFAVGEAQAHLDRLMVLGQVTRVRDGQVWRYYRA